MLSNTPELLTPKQVSDVLRVSYEGALAFIKHSGIDYVKIGRQYRVERGKLQAFLMKKGTTVIPLDPS